MASGFYEIEGGTQPATPAAGFARIWYDTTAGQWKVLLPSGANTPISNIVGETELTIPAPEDVILVYDVSAGAFRKMRCDNLAPTSIQNRFLTFDEDEFAGTTTGGKLDWNMAVAGTGASGQNGTYGVNGTERAMGVLQIDTGTTATGRAALNRMVNQVQLGYCAFEQVWRQAIEVLSNATERFIVTTGFADNSAINGEPTDGVYFRYSDNVNSGNWQCCTRNGGALNETIVNTTVAASTNYSIFRINVNEAATSAEFYINDVLVGTITTNIPSTAGNFTGILTKIEKTVGLTQRNLSIDYFTQKAQWTTAR
jgi:hypothetical protein